MSMTKRSPALIGVWLILFVACGTRVWAEAITSTAPTVSASTVLGGFTAEGAINGERFSAEPGSAWKGGRDATNWWWQIQFDQPRAIGAVLQIIGDHPFILRNAPRRYTWRGSVDGRVWFELKDTRTENERRIFRIQRLRKPIRVQYLQLEVDAVTGDFPTVREVEFYSKPNAAVDFADWMVVVDTTEKEKLPGEGQGFISLARECPGWDRIQAQQIWVGNFDDAFAAAEPRPLCAFLSGNFKDWCEVAREPWRGTQEILKDRRLPMWASCGGAQGLAILTETGVDRPWDCPHCRDPMRPRLPIYTHLGHTGRRPCGDYSACVFERGPRWVRQVARDPVFAGVPREFQVMESHCGQIEWPPKGWRLIGSAGEGTVTKNQCLRLADRYIYAAQFHIDMDGTPDNSRRIMANFLALAKSWGGYNDKGLPARTPTNWPAAPANP